LVFKGAGPAGQVLSWFGVLRDAEVGGRAWLEVLLLPAVALTEAIGAPEGSPKRGRSHRAGAGP